MGAQRSSWVETAERVMSTAGEPFLPLNKPTGLPSSRQLQLAAGAGAHSEDVTYCDRPVDLPPEDGAPTEEEEELLEGGD